MSIPQGYKQTELGIIPEDWEVGQLGDCVNVFDGTHQTPNYVPVGVPFYSVENVTSNDFAHTKYISPNEHRILTSRYKIQKGDILMTRIGSIGVCKYVDWDVDASFYVSLALLKPYNINALYLSKASNATYFKDSILLNSLQFAIPQKINLGNISNVKILIPPVAEQRAIAEALSDMDGLIAALDKKIAKKRLIKQGVMQQLLTGKTRLPGFTEERREKKLGEIGSLSMCKRIFQEETSECGDVPFYKIGTFGHDADAFISKEKYEHYKKLYRYPNKGDILISAAGTIGRTVVYDGKPAYFQDSNIVWLSHDQKCILNSYLYYIYQITEWNTENTTIARLYNDIFNGTIVSFPRSLAEQQAIVEILDNMDKEITNLEAQRDKYRLVKSGMMQKLLTGQIRLNTK